MNNLPIYNVVDEIKKALNKNNRLILEAPAGAGKSTVVPISLLKEDFLGEKIILVLQPRRVAARVLAKQMAKLLREDVGLSIGYQIKMEKKFSSKTKILIVTQAILTRKLQNNPSLDDVSLIIFDEFHERSIHSDLGLALAIQTQDYLREDLKILIMSATLNSNSLKKQFNNSYLIKSEGRLFPIEEVYLDLNIKHPKTTELNKLIKEKIYYSLKNDEGDILVFLAGIKEINSLLISLKEELDNSILLLPLHSKLSKKEQDLALEKNTKRKIILSTNIAQTSLTIQGVNVVIDSGLEKNLYFDLQNDLEKLNTEFISQASSIQRAGRAGRLSKGKVYRLWHQNRILNKEDKPEILRLDISSFLLELCLWGANIKEILLLDLPKEDVINNCYKFLEFNKLIYKNKDISNLGKKVLKLGLSPRLSLLILKANELGFGKASCYLASILLNKDIFNISSISLFERYERLIKNKSAYKELVLQGDFFYEKLKATVEIKENKTLDEKSLSIVILHSYGNRLAKKKGLNTYILGNKKRVIIKDDENLTKYEYLIIPKISSNEKINFANLALQIEYKTIKNCFPDYLRFIKEISFENEKLISRENTYFGDLLLSSKPLEKNKDLNFKELFLSLIKKEGLSLLTWDKKINELKDKLLFLNLNYEKEKFPLFEDDYILENLEDIFGFYLNNIKTIKELKSLNVYEILFSLISWEKQQIIEELAPSFFKVPSGSKIKIDYSFKTKAVLKVKIQEIFGLNDNPKILNNSFPLQIELLTPALRPIQITYDLKSFWENSYLEIRKELRGKYKKHYWPENPYEAVATKKIKKYM